MVRLVALCLVFCSCAGKPDRAAPVVKPPVVEGPASLFTQAAATYITQAERITDEHVGVNRATASIAYSGFTVRGRFQSNSESTADYGVLTTRVRATATDATFPVNTALAEASWTDTLVADHPDAAFLVLTVDARIDAAGLQPGGAHSHGSPDVSSHMFFRHQGGDDAELGGDPMRAGQVSTPRAPVRPGQPITVSLVLSTLASIPLNYSATVSATTTLHLRAVAVLDAQGTPIPGAAVRSSSGWPAAGALSSP